MDEIIKNTLEKFDENFNSGSSHILYGGTVADKIKAFLEAALREVYVEGFENGCERITEVSKQALKEIENNI